ncbi:hypothetical protein AB0D49_10415 [Streptomyces sp. NPDC048290]|uniref:hypothetical protein n=1 Tax=Streptomyces sp. NPDC048290 TaxID=3155811 RepID=UPI00342A4DFF
MSTEAQRPPLPPRPSVPPHPTRPPTAAAPPDPDPADSNTPTPRTPSLWERPSRPTPPTLEPATPEADAQDTPDIQDAPEAEPAPIGSATSVATSATSSATSASDDDSEPGTAPSPAPAPPPPPASARFPDTAPTAGRPPRRPHIPPETPGERTRRLRPVPAPDGHHPASHPPFHPAPHRPYPPTVPPPRPAQPPGPDPARSWSALGGDRPMVSFGRPEGYDADARPRPLGRRLRGRTLAAASCVVLGLGLIGGALTGSWLAEDSAAARERDAYATAGDMWHSVPVDRLFPPAVDGKGAGPGGADRTWTRVAVAPDGGCADAFDPLLRGALAPVGCARLLRATYTDATQSFVTTVGLLFTGADATAMRALAQRFEDEGLARRDDLMPRPYAAKDTVAAGFGDAQRASWTVHVLTDAPVVVYSVSGWTDDRAVDTPQPAADAVRADAATDPAQAGLGHEAKGLADRIERALRKTATSPTEQPS